jgi:acetyl-CoA carboxylase biotin carboxyl carrier protein
MVGTFYRSPAPEAKPYVEVGDVIHKGQVVCIIEAMKIMNEIESDVTGRVFKVLVDDSKPVGFGTPLFELEPIPV